VVRYAKDMASMLYQYNGVGLSAPQVQLRLRIIVVDVVWEKDGSSLLYLINPEIVSEEGTIIDKEGCLSFPGFYMPVKRSAKIVVSGHQLDGTKITITAEGLMSRVLQHEIDHLEGLTFLQRVTPKVRHKAMKKWLKKVEGKR